MTAQCMYKKLIVIYALYRDSNDSQSRNREADKRCRIKKKVYRKHSINKLDPIYATHKMWMQVAHKKCNSLYFPPPKKKITPAKSMSVCMQKYKEQKNSFYRSKLYKFIEKKNNTHMHHGVYIRKKYKRFCDFFAWFLVLRA